MKVLLKGFIGLLIIILIGGIGAKYYYEVNTKPVSTDNDIESVEVEIPSGSSTSKIASLLEENKLIRNTNVFRVVSKLKGTDGKLKAGFYNLNTGMSPGEILDELVEGGRSGKTIKFTIPEGYTIEEMADKLSKEEIINRETFINLTNNIDKFSEDYEFLNEIPEGNNMEGYLFPETYEVYADSSEEEIIRKMLDQFNSVYVEKLKGKKFKQGLNINQLITLASIVERESMVDEERSKVAEVFYNRLEIGMKLQSCATVQYILGERKPNLSIADTQIDSVYNTYLNTGLPPAPIATPGLEAIEATINPEEHDFLYFVLKDDGSSTHTFSTNYSDHLKAK
ncbi:endolytic transglycosylase MltG [Clostridium sp. D2Q-11]|uniref:Endolytic murein transglycosylase n=1 Tax=Anaeromonas frigoriresistens TaxID=2683708 RepID=A0A942V541_9FIRM|nr:endolytic transglycosylase MltG [Anaeromonas frigoriresistens]MBS4540032.1 endolytic transglycosylase MltG [Anaeromonas frigoriresistens]